LPLIVISPFAKSNFVDKTLTDRSSILRFIADNWGTSRIGGGSFDVEAGPLTNMFNFSGNTSGVLILDPMTGEPQ
jgi:phospholipase C